MTAQDGGTGYRAIVDTHRHPVGPKLRAKMAEVGAFDPNQEFPQTNAKDLIVYRDFVDLDYAMPKQREGGVTLSIASTNQRPPSEYLKTNILVDCMGFSPIGLRAAIEMCGVDRVVFGSDYGGVPYGIKKHVQIVEDVLPSPADRELVFWRTSNKVFRLGLVDTDLVTPGFAPVAAA
jgi:predicted TIM-barrel fold metal-dependent hydrolase